MARSGNEGLVLGLTVLITAGLAGGGYWFFTRNNPNGLQQVITPNPASTVNPVPPVSKDPTPAPPNSTTAALDTSLPNPQVLNMDGSVTMVALIKRLQLAYAQVNLNIPSTFGVPDGRPNGTNAGLKNLMQGIVNIAACSRPLKAEEIQSGLLGVPVARDALAVVVGIDNPYKGGLTLNQLRGIFQGTITNWEQVGGAKQPIKVINRATESGTRTFFKDAVLLGGDFAPDSKDFTTLPHDETTPMLRALGKNGIGYSTVQQAVNQEIVRIVPIDGVAPTDVNAVKTGVYPISRVVLLVAKKQTSPVVKEFIDLALSQVGQEIVRQVGFIPL
ncbi:ABC-type phosphate transport system, periplasmic component [Synechococcus sp. PCC 7502]|uniref:phosphate ABC transporter substrate-binding protein n=1 Tax=Synechococcus sp. PCC 7502 TaxID=1173263 RepID=UPI00029FDA7D|nr:phosphate ABC transporter substrate-binding protein [Synechococcus sp. PCC 7502]AFY72360.1 ABC-type phosphate transport system, periplasmic component [Synechococcus sp. PCC 7502]